MIVVNVNEITMKIHRERKQTDKFGESGAYGRRNPKKAEEREILWLIQA